MTVYTIKEYAQIYKLHVVTVRSLIRQGKIKGAVKIGAHYRIIEKD